MNRFSKQHIKPGITSALLFGCGIFVLIEFHSSLSANFCAVIGAIAFVSFWKMVGEIQEFSKDGKKQGLEYFKKQIDDLEADIRKLEIKKEADEPWKRLHEQDIERKRRKIEDYKTYFEYKKQKTL